MKYRRISQPGTVDAVQVSGGWKTMDQWGNQDFWSDRWFRQFFEPVT